MFSPRGFIKKFQIRKNNSENKEPKTERTKRGKAISYDSDESVRSALLEILIYIIFLAVTTVVANASHHLYMFYFNQTLERIFLGRTTETKFGAEVGFDELVTTADWWSYLETNFLGELHGWADDRGSFPNGEGNSSNGHKNASEQGNEEEDEEDDTITEEIPENEGVTVEDNDDDMNTENNDKISKRSVKLIRTKKRNEEFNEFQRLFLRDNILLRPPRLRQIRVKENTCLVHDIFLTYFNACYAGYSKSIEDRAEVYKKTKFYKTSELKVNPLHGEITTYYGAGYVQNLTFNRAENEKVLESLKQRKWIDRGTRIIILEFVLFNSNAFMFDNVKIIAEIPPVGGIVPSHQFQALKYNSIWTEDDVGLYIAGGIFYIMVVYYTVEEILQFIRIGVKEYLKSVWNILDIVVLILSYLSFIYNIIHPLYLNRLMKAAEENPDDFVSIDYICYWNLLYIDMMGICVFLVWIKIFKYISFNKTMLQFSTTLKRCAKDLFGFAVMFFIVFLAYAQLGLLIFGTSHPDFREFGISVITLMRMFLGDFEYQLIEEANHILGPIYFLTYVLFVFFILLNMFLAIINDTYGAVKSEVRQGRSKFGSYLTKIFRKLFPFCFSKAKIGSEEDDITELTEVMDHSTRDNADLSAHTSKSYPDTQPISADRVRKRESEVIREYFEELPANSKESPIPQLAKENGEIKRLNNRITLLEEVLEQLIIIMDRILKKVETKKTKRN